MTESVRSSEAHKIPAMGEYTHLGPPGTGLATRDRRKVEEKTKKTRIGSSYKKKETAFEGSSVWA